VKAATAAGVPTLMLLTGGFAETDLREAGAVEVARSIVAPREHGVERNPRPRPLTAFALSFAI
jgi:hypothetical protein